MERGDGFLVQGFSLLLPLAVFAALKDTEKRRCFGRGRFFGC